MKKLAWMLIPVFVLAFAFSFAVNASAHPAPPDSQYNCCGIAGYYQGVIIFTWHNPLWEIDCVCDPVYNPNNCPLNCN